MWDQDDKKLSSFLGSFPTYRLQWKPESPFSSGLWVFGLKDEAGSLNKSHSDDIGDKIKSAFYKVDYDWGVLVQFWAPVTIGGQQLLSTSGQPFAVSHPCDHFERYRKLCVINKLSIGDVIEQHGEPPVNMISDPPASAFLNRLPQLIFLDRRVHKVGGPLLRYGSEECKFGISCMIPIYLPSQTSSSVNCIGVVECSSVSHSNLNFVSTMITALKEEGLNVFNVQDRIPDKIINGTKAARNEIQQALKTVCELHNIGLAQVWISYENENHVHFSSSLEDTQRKQVLGLKLTSYIPDKGSAGYHWSYKEYHDACDMVPLQMGYKRVLKTLQDHISRSCQTYFEPGNDQWTICNHTSPHSRGLAICLRRIDAVHFDYAFEFAWIHTSNNVILLEDLLLTLKKLLPNFKFASGAELGEEFLVDNFTESEIKKFDSFQRKISSPMPESLEKGKKQMVVDAECKTAAILLAQQASETLLDNFFGNRILMADLDDESLSEFLETFPTYRLHRKPECDGELWVFRSQNNSSSDEFDAGMICETIKSAFTMVNNGEELIVQFWAPVKIGDKILLSTSGQPFAVSNFGDDLKNYREYCVKYEYHIDMNNNKIILDDNEDEDHQPVINGPPATAFLNRLPEAVLDTEIHPEGSLMGHASECGLWTSYTLPICCPSQKSSCIGVVECSSISSINLDVVNTMNRALKEVGLTVFNVQDYIPYKTINGLKLTRGEIEKALKIVCDLHKIGLAQVWISFEDKNLVPFSSSLEDTQTTPKLALKLTGYNSVVEDTSRRHRRFNQYYDACDMVPLRMGEELVENTLQDYEPRYCENISQMGSNMLMAWVSNDEDGCSGLTICMRSTHTGDFNYAFEFIWPHNSNNVNVLEELLLALKRCLPSFKLASGAELGDELHVIDVDNSTECEIKQFKIFQGKRLLPIPKALKDRKKQLAVNYIAPLDMHCKEAPILLPQQVIEHQLEQAAKDLHELGDHLDVIDVENSTKSDTRDLMIIQGKRLSPVHETMRKGKKAVVVDNKAPSKPKRDTTKKQVSREDIEQHYGKTMKEAANELKVSLSTLKRKHKELGLPAWQGPDLKQRKATNCDKYQSKQSHINENDNGAIQVRSPVNSNEYTVIIKANYAGDIIKLRLGISEATYVTVENEISKKFKLKHGTFKIKYLDEDKEWIVMTSDQDMSDCIQSSRNVDKSAIRLRVLPTLRLGPLKMKKWKSRYGPAFAKRKKGLAV